MDWAGLILAILMVAVVIAVIAFLIYATGLIDGWAGDLAL